MGARGMPAGRGVVSHDADLGWEGVRQLTGSSHDNSMELRREDPDSACFGFIDVR
jgi:hypothetical protein